MDAQGTYDIRLYFPALSGAENYIQMIVPVLDRGLLYLT
jgi:hypothetical protein